ncbi:MAG TPA: hypothetical protein VFA94_05480 [Acidimicrobiales bacterium]|nr:hypothetical protein [Acidimicrobiales bacterium]
MELALFDAVGEVLRGLVPRELGRFHCRPRQYGIKVWFGAASSPAREHYEAQVIGAGYVDDAAVLALEVGFHAEHPKVADNDAALAHMLRHERSWRKAIGAEAVAGPFLGRADVWRRLSETWPDPDLSDPDLPVEIGARLTDYVVALEPFRCPRQREKPAE